MFIGQRSIEQRVILVHLHLANSHSGEDLTEFQQLATSAGIDIERVVVANRTIPDAKYFIGRGKAQQIKEMVTEQEIELVLFNHALSASQERNLQQFIQCRVLDRIGLILDIFAQRAQTFEGKLQVELAQLNHLTTRLVRGWQHLARQKGGIGLRGPGETQLETDRRLIRERIKFINKRLGKVRKQRAQNRHARQRAALPIVSTVGYTNAGKTSLFNCLTGADGFAADQLFATLDPSMRRIDLPGASDVALTDTVGFIRHLPIELIEAFHATLEEIRSASLLLHVIDVSDSNWRDHAGQVEQVLQQLDADRIPRLTVFNKIDCLPGTEPRLLNDDQGRPDKVWVSVETRAGVDILQSAIRDRLFGDPIERRICLTPCQGMLRAQLYQLGAVLEEHIDQNGHWQMMIRLAKSDFIRFFPDSFTEKISQEC